MILQLIESGILVLVVIGGLLFFKRIYESTASNEDRLSCILMSITLLFESTLIMLYFILA